MLWLPTPLGGRREEEIMRIPKSLVIVGLSLTLACGGGVLFVACGGDDNVNAGGGDDGGNPDGTLSDAGDDGGGGGEGGGTYDGSWYGDGGNCLKLGGKCTTNGDCCSNDCVGGVCSVPPCVSDNQSCQSNNDCCSANCTNGKCVPLNNGCLTLGNQCQNGAQCCSQRCAGGTCQPSSFCGQPGDVCLTNVDCCTGVCNKAQNQFLGTCAQNPPGGPANCGLVDGVLCGGGQVPDGGFPLNDAGLPNCGGDCCSRACAPWGPTQTLICQPASGCHVVGDLCTKDSDCCGSAGMPNGPTKPVTCVIGDGGVGVCRNPVGCKPDGDVCKLKGTSCNASCDCCSGNCNQKDTCHQDNMGVPRCSPESCEDAGGGCASSASCCNGNPCVPNPVDGGQPPYICWPSSCVLNCGKCTNSADCCPGEWCTNGICGPCGGPDGGTPDAGGDGGPPPCASYGQLCGDGGLTCCNNVPCTNGRCEFPIH